MMFIGRERESDFFERPRPPRVNRRAFYNGHTEQNTMEVKLF